MLGGGSARVHSRAGGLDSTHFFFFFFLLDLDLGGIVGDVRGGVQGGRRKFKLT